MVILSFICIVLLMVVIRLWLAIGDYKRTIDQTEKMLRQYDTWLRATSTWLDDEMIIRSIQAGKKSETIQFKVCKN